MLAFVIFVTVIASALSGCAAKPINHGLIVDKSHYPEVVVDGQHTDEHCTLTIQEDNSSRTGEVEVPCGELDFYTKGSWWIREGYPSPSEKAK